MNNELSQILNKYGDTVYRVALSRCGSPETAQDIYQQTFLLLLEKKPRFSDTAQLRRWLIRVAIKLAAGERRKFDNSKTVPLDDHDRPISDELTFELIDLLSVLDETSRTVTLLFYIEDMSIDTVARTLNLSNAAVKMRLSHARKTLKKIYKEEIL